ncbi:MAG: adenylyl-sulfate kinase [Stagnimonas sp.]|nr:adenylyl-sulfate kinase [Stagnimonas sp.]
MADTRTPAQTPDLVWHSHTVTPAERAALKGQRPCIIWLTGLSGAGKSTLANELECALLSMAHHCYLLDGDNVRHSLNKDLGFSPQDRVENIRRIGEVAKLFVDAGQIIITAFISPYKADRQMVRELVAADEFVEIYVKTPLAVCEERDPKGLYAKARAGLIKGFTGIDSPYEAPENPELEIDTSALSLEACVHKVLRYLQDADRIRAVPAQSE